MSNTNTGVIERKATIFNIQKYNMYDGPGIRTLVFFKGCPLRCKWCANPEGLERKFQVMFKSSSCTNCGACVSVCPVGIHAISKDDQKHEVLRNIDCLGCNKCVEVCNAKALTIVGEVKTISELLEIILEDRTFYEVSGGGVTLGGGEVTMQPEAATSLLQACKQEGINTAIETCGYTKLENILKIAEFTDLFLYDIKQMNSDKHFELTGVRNELILSNLKELLHRRYNVQVRMPMLKGINDSEDEIKQVIEFLMPFRDYKNFKGIDLLPYHKLGVNKYNQLGKEYPIKGDPSLSEEDLDRIEGWIKKYDFPVSVIRH
ncbi:choline TMA-lyase-activating enzyme [Aminipila sp.]|jgi:pyruvate formate lyase activating enzyme|uniref:choline TMA-lyase-activating enzyme n=1 Tax=Aminipila sp. TaxID=2060095 RepID=UPI001D91DE90|nr:choline TMA-lyase-activating enzyme [Aminipila sp.]MBE6035818.1 choline TMA-lyase-activating enzyme [Clostridiales bacterium]